MNRWPSHQTFHDAHPKPVALITPNQRGGVSLVLPDAGVAIGHYDTHARASEVAILNGYTPQIEGGGTK